MVRLSITERFPGWPNVKGEPVIGAGVDGRKLRPMGTRQRDVLQRTLDAYSRSNRGVTAPDIGAKTPQDRGAIYLIWRTLERRGLVLRDPPGVKGTIPAPGAADALAAAGARDQGPTLAPKARVLFGKRVAPDTATGTAFPSTVADPDGFPFQPGDHTGKLGRIVAKGRWAGMPIYALTLEERATCPRTCQMWTSCYGNGMPLAKRYRHGPQLEDRIRVGLWDLDGWNPQGYVIRLHILGDFYSVAYALLWRQLLDLHPLLNVFGYTAHSPDSEVGRVIRFTRMMYRDRWAVRFSGASIKFSARTINRLPDKPRQPEGFACPEQLGLVPDCASCGLCWTSRDPILFVDHAYLGK